MISPRLVIDALVRSRVLGRCARLHPLRQFSIPHVGSTGPEYGSELATWSHTASAGSRRIVVNRSTIPNSRPKCAGFGPDSDLYVLFTLPTRADSALRIQQGPPQTWTATWSSSSGRRLERHQALSRIRDRADSDGSIGHRPDRDS